MKRLALLILVLLIALPTCYGIERRKKQFYDEPSHLILPLPYSIPGIGQGMMAIGLLGNVLGSYTDVYVLAINGDAAGTIGAVQDFHIIPETFWVSYFYQNLSRAAVSMYDKRGMTTAKEDYKLIELNKVYSTSTSAVLSLWERRIELSYIGFEQDIGITRILSPKGDVITDFAEPYTSSAKTSLSGATLDYTDDFQDPRVGLRLHTNRNQSSAASTRDPEYYVQNNSASFYIPMGSASTWAFNVYTSDAIVSKEGISDEASIKAELGLACPAENTACLTAEAGLVADFQAQRKYGTADGLGGQNRMRAYPQNRFQAAHSLYYGTEFRWNFDEEVTPFDFWIWQDVSTGFQLAFFHESGTVADLKSDLGVITRTSSGVGLRMVSASGFVYRADVASGNEGSATTMIFSYPW